MSEQDTMHHLDLFDALSHIVPAAPAVVCDPGVRLDPDDVWCDRGARIYGADVWCDPGVRIDPPAPLTAPLAALLPALLPATPPALWLDEEPAWELPRILPDRRVALPAIPTSLSFKERVTQRCLDLAERLGWGDAGAVSLLTEIMEAGSPDHVLVRTVEDHDAIHAARVLHTAWELRSVWASDGPEHVGPMTWHLATTIVTCWYSDDSDADDMLTWLDDAFKVWRGANPYSYSWGFHVDLMGWLEAEGADALAYGEFPWDDLSPDRHTSEPRW
jgi:hypothetical protein